MAFLDALAGWFAEPANWQGEAGIPQRLGEHVELCAFALATAALIAVPLGVLLGHIGRAEVAATAAINVGRAIPSFAILALALPVSIRLGLGLGFWPTWLAMVALAIPPIFTNALTGVRSVDAAVVEVARGVGMNGMRVLRAVEIPIALPVILAGVRTSAVNVVATAPLGALVAWGGLGRFIIDGRQTQDYAEMAGGAVLVAALAITTEIAFALLERAVTPRALRPSRRRLVAERADVVESARSAA